MTEPQPDLYEAVPGFECIDHVAFSVPLGELGRQVRLYEQMGFRQVHREDVLGTDQVREVLLQVGSSRNYLQLLEPLSQDSPVQKQLDRNGGRGGFAHMALRVSNASAAFTYLKEQGFQIIDPSPRPGSRGTTVFFLHPKSHADGNLGVLIEVVEGRNEE